MSSTGIPMRLRQLLAVVGFLALTFVAQVAFAAPSAGTPAGQSAAPSAPQATPPADAQGGINTLVQPPPIQGQSQPMLFEQYGPLDYSGLTTSFGIGDVNIINDEGNGEATAEATGMYLLGIISARIVEWCLSLNLVSQLGPTINQFTRGLEASLYQQYLPLILVLAAIVIGWTLLVMRRFLGGLGGILWAALAISLAVQLFLSPASYLDAADRFASGATNAIIVGVARENPGAPQGSYQQPNGDANYEVRQLADRLWMVSVYDPWTMIEFGTVDPTVQNGDHLGIELLKKNDGKPSNYDQDIQTAPQWIQQWADGNWGVPRAMFGLFLVVLGGILLLSTLLIALTVIVGTLTAIVLGCLTVPVWLLAPIPGFGLRLLVSWLGGIIAGLAVSTMGALYLVLMLALLGAVQQIEGTVGLITVGVLDVGLVVVAFWLRKSFFRVGRHVARLPVAAVAGQSLAAPSRDGQKVTKVTVHRHGSHDRQRVSTPSPATARWVGGSAAARAPAIRTAASPARAAAIRAGAAGGGAGAATGAAGTAGTAGVAATTAGTAGTALAALGAVKAGQHLAHTHDSARRRVQGLVDTASPPSAAVPPSAVVPPVTAPLPGLESQNGHSEDPALPGRLGQNGVRAFRAPRVDPPNGARANGNGAHRLESPPYRPMEKAQGKRRRVRTLTT